MGTDAVAIAGRTLVLLCFYQAVGGALFTALFARQLPDVCAQVRRLTLLCAISGAVLVLVQLPLTAARMAGEFAGLSDHNLMRLAVHSSHAVSCGLMIIGLLILALGLARRWLPVMLLGAALAVCAPALTGHTTSNPRRALLAPLLIVHVAAGAFWLGALWPLWLTLKRESPEIAAEAVRRFSRLAGWLVPCIAVAGIGMAWGLIEDWSVLRRPYGRMLLGKLTLFMLLMILAGLNRWRITPALMRSAGTASRTLRRAIVAEYLLIAVVLAMTATLTALFSPDD